MRDIKEEVRIGVQMAKHPPKPGYKVKNKTDRNIVQHAIMVLNYKVIYPGITDEDRKNLDLLNKLAEEYDNKRVERRKK